MSFLLTALEFKVLSHLQFFRHSFHDHERPVLLPIMVSSNDHLWPLRVLEDLPVPEVVEHGRAPGREVPEVATLQLHGDDVEAHEVLVVEEVVTVDLQLPVVLLHEAPPESADGENVLIEPVGVAVELSSIEAVTVALPDPVDEIVPGDGTKGLLTVVDEILRDGEIPLVEEQLALGEFVDAEDLLMRANLADLDIAGVLGDVPAKKILGHALRR